MPPQIRVRDGDLITAALINSMLQRLDDLESKQKDTKDTKDTKEKETKENTREKDEEKVTDKIAKDTKDTTEGLTTMPTVHGVSIDQPGHGRAFIRREERPPVGQRVLDEPGEPR